MAILKLKSNLTKYDPAKLKEEKIDLGNNKLREIQQKDYLDLSKVKSTLSIQDSNTHKIVTSEDKVKSDYNIIDKEWMKQRELFNYKSILEIGTQRPDLINSNKLKSISLSTNIRNNVVISDFNKDIITNEYLAGLDKLRKKDTVYNIDKYKLDIVDEDLSDILYNKGNSFSRINKDLNEKTITGIITRDPGLFKSSYSLRMEDIYAKNNRLLDVQMLDSAFNEAIKLIPTNLIDKKQFNSNFDFDEIPNIDGFQIRPEHFKTEFDAFESNLSNRYNTLVDYFDNKYALGFTRKQTEMLYVVDATELRWKKDRIPSVNYLDIKGEHQVGLLLNPEPLATNYFVDSSRFVWKNTEIPSVDYLDLKLQYQAGFNLRTAPLRTYYIKDASMFDWDGESVQAPVVNYFDQNFLFTNRGFEKFTPFKVTDYIKDSSEFDWDGLSIDAPEVNYFDRSFLYTTRGYQKFTPFKVTDYIKDSSEFDWDGESFQAPEVDYFDRNKLYTTRGYQKFTPFKVTDYIKDSSEFDWDGESFQAPEVDYFDQTKLYTNRGYQKFTPFKVTDYIKDSSEFDWNGESSQAPEVDYFDQNKLYTTRGYQKFTPFKISDYIKDSSEFDWDGLSNDAPEVDYFDQNKLFTTKGYQKFTPFKISDYIKDSSEFDWNGFKIDAPEVNYFDSFGKYQFGFNKYTEFKRSYYVNEASEFDDVNLLKYNEGNSYERPGSFYDLNPRFKRNYPFLYTKLGDARENSHQIDPIWHQPYIIRGVGNFDQLGPEYYGGGGVIDEDGMIRGGIVTYADRALEDVIRIGKRITSGRGLLYTIRQTALQLTNPNVETDAVGNVAGGFLDYLIGGIVNDLLPRSTQIYNPLVPILSAKGLTGVLFNRHGLNPLNTNLFGNYENVVDNRNLNSNYRRSIFDQDRTGNRLLILAKDLIYDKSNSPFSSIINGILSSYISLGLGMYKGQEIDYLSGYMGPNSFFGIGATPIRRYFVTNNDDFEDIGDGELYRYARYSVEKQYASGENGNLAVKSVYTLLRDSNRNKKESLSEADTTGFSDIESIASLITNLETYKESEIYHIKNTTHKIKSPINSLKGTLADKLISKDTTISVPIMNLNSLQLPDFDIAGAMGAGLPAPDLITPEPTFNFEDQVLPTKYGVGLNSYSELQEKAKTLRENRRAFDVDNKETRLGTLISSNMNTLAGHDSDDVNGMGLTHQNYVALSYDDISYMAEGIRYNRATDMRNNGSFTLLKAADKDRFAKYIENREDRLNYISGLFVSENNDVERDVIANLLTNRSMGNHGYPFKGGVPHKRNNRYGFKFPGDGRHTDKLIEKKSDNDELYEKFNRYREETKGDTVNLIDVVNGWSKNLESLYESKNASDSIKLVFSTANYNPVSNGSKGINSVILPFRATLKSIDESFSPEWEGYSIIGRGDKSYMYSGFERSLSFEFIIVATTIEEHYTNWRKINELASFTAPDYGQDGMQRMLGPVIRLTVGDLYLGVPGFLTTLSYTYNFESNVEIAGYDIDGTDLNKEKHVLALPGIIQVSIGFKVIGNHRAERSGKIIELKNSEGKSWLGKENRIIREPAKPPKDPPQIPPSAPLEEPPIPPKVILHGVNFESDKDILIVPEGPNKLDEVAESLKKSPSVKIHIVGHTDSTNTDAYNQDLSERRAKRVMEYLKSKGVTNDITFSGKGEKEPIASNATPAGRAKNRRVEMYNLNDATNIGRISFK